MSSAFSTCALCPRLCRPTCPVATGSAREAATPSAIAVALLRWERGEWSAELAATAATLCTDCGGCEAWCHLGRPLPALLRQARATLLPAPDVSPLGAIEGEGTAVAIEADARSWAPALARRLGRPVRRWGTDDRLGIALVEHPAFAQRAADLRAAVGSLEPIVADGGVAHALTAAGIGFRWLHEVLPELAVGVGSCRVEGAARPLGCCGAAGPLAAHHPDDARRTGEAFARRLSDAEVLDGRCRDHLAACGRSVRDAVDRLLENP